MPSQESVYRLTSGDFTLKNILLHCNDLVTSVDETVIKLKIVKLSIAFYKSVLLSFTDPRFFSFIYNSIAQT